MERLLMDERSEPLTNESYFEIWYIHVAIIAKVQEVNMCLTPRGDVQMLTLARVHQP